jgi:hypothetical protein
MYVVLERLNFRQHGQVDSKKHNLVEKIWISGFTPIALEILVMALGMHKNMTGLYIYIIIYTNILRLAQLRSNDYKNIFVIKFLHWILINNNL